MSERKITKLYESLRELGQVSPDQVPQEAIETIASSFEVSGEIQSNAVALLARIANETTEAEFVDALESGDLPAIALSEAEMETFNGGRKRARRDKGGAKGEETKKKKKIDWCGRCW
ncbi:MAG: hypothetical protein CMH56_08695 [Myxococcales bacterium]|nr:hypothetical protein [Myxococcales bacterium]|tara:strand:+ start:513 stop:863 length:351 start_codon:yes stop_codon:yes gene_type:complete